MTTNDFRTGDLVRVISGPTWKGASAGECTPGGNMYRPAFEVGHVAEITQRYADGVASLSPGSGDHGRWYCDFACLEPASLAEEVQAAIESITKGVPE